MNERRAAFLEAALLCSRYADNLKSERPEWAEVALECSRMIEDEAESENKTYPPGAPVVDLDAVMEWCGDSESRLGIKEAIEMYQDEL